jgi:hypothetical protein
MNLQTGEKTFVSRLRIRRSGGLDPLTARLRVASLFQAADVQPASLSPAAIVCIRRLNDPRPRTVSLARGNSHLPPEWQESVRGTIEQLVRRAPYPAREFVAANEPCVIFADRAELLAALADDWCEHRATSRWWWQSLFKEAINSGTLVKLWQQSPEYVPGALEHLARRARATRLAAALSEDAARAILQSLTRRFALSKLEAAIFHTPQPAPHERREVPLEESPPESLLSGVAQETSHTASGKLEAPWQGFVPESQTNDLPLLQQCLLGVGLVLQRAPALARSISFAHRVNTWITAREFSDQPANARASSASRTKEPHDASMRRIDSLTEPLAASTRDALEAREDSRAPSPVSKLMSPASNLDAAQNSHAPEVSDAVIDPLKLEDAQTPAPLPRASSAQDAARAERDDAAQVAASDAGLSARACEIGDGGAGEVEFEIEDGERAQSAQATDTRVELQEAGEASAFVAQNEATAETHPALVAHIETRYGGLFHLINLALFLELYGDFTSPSEPGIALPIWDFVALLGRRLGGAGVETDPVWPLLAELAGRGAGQLAGEDFAPPDEWRVPVAWLRMFPPPDVWKWTTTRGANSEIRLQLIHPAKFLVLDVPLDRKAGAKRQLARELEIYAGAFSGVMLKRAARPYKLRGRTPLALWVERLHGFVRARLRYALGIVDAKRAARLVCERHASVFVTTTHVDIVMRLAELPFEVRVAGLDRNAGWVPAAGRFIAFHFE